MKKEFEATINLTQMDREAVDYFTMSEILETYPDVSGVIINELEFDYSANVFYAHTGLGRVIFPRHLNETLEDIEDIMNGDDTDDPWRFAFHPYSYTFGDRHGYSAKFYILNATSEYIDTDNVRAQDELVKEHLKEKMNKLYGNIVKKLYPYYNECYEKDCALCPHYKYCTPTYEETHSKNTDTDPCYGETICTGTNNPYQE